MQQGCRLPGGQVERFTPVTGDDETSTNEADSEDETTGQELAFSVGTVCPLTHQNDIYGAKKAREIPEKGRIEGIVHVSRFYEL